MKKGQALFPEGKKEPVPADSSSAFSSAAADG
jgi:hypothetical protein